MRVFVLGGNGFVGSAYVRLLGKRGIDCSVIDRANYAEYRSQTCDVLVNANGNSRKFIADRDPKGEFAASVSSVVASLEDFQADKYVFLSSGDVYPDQSTPETTKEEQLLSTRSMSRYGLHKFIAEEVVRAVHPKWLVMRMGGFVGPGMKKNCIYDMLHGPQVWLDADSELQFIGTDSAAEIVWRVIEAGVVQQTLNLGARGTIRVGDLYKRLGSRVPFAIAPSRVRFELALDKLSQCVGALPRTVDEVSRFCGSAGDSAAG